MKRSRTVVACALALAALSATAQTPTARTTAQVAKIQYGADSKAALLRYDSDKKLCNDETSSAGRLQCRRDARAEYDKAMTEAKAKLAAATPAGTTASGSKAAKVACPDCGKVTAASVTEREGEGSAVGVVAGGAAGAVLGHQLGSGLGKDIATVAGAVGGAYAGKEIEKKVKTHKVWTVSVQYEDGSKGSYEFKEDPGFAVGQAVRKSGNSVVRR